MTNAVVQTTHQFCFVVCFSLFFRVGFPLFHGCWWFLVFWSDLKYPVPYNRFISKLFSGSFKL
jgi:hypothetical protein